MAKLDSALVPEADSLMLFPTLSAKSHQLIPGGDMLTEDVKPRRTAISI